MIDLSFPAYVSIVVIVLSGAVSASARCKEVNSALAALVKKDSEGKDRRAAAIVH